MHPRTEEINAYLDANRAALLEEVERVAPALRETRPAPDRWSVAEVLEHLALVERRITGLLAGSLSAARAEGLGPERETGPVVGTFDLTRVLDRGRPVEATAAARPLGGLDARGALAALEESRAALREVLFAGDGLALGEVSLPHPVFGPLNFYQWVLFVGGHEARHVAQIRGIAGALAAPQGRGE